MIVGFHSPLPPSRTGVAEYSRSLLRGLRALGKVEVSADRADVHLYHIGNNGLHTAIYRRALETPGVVVLHDAVLNHFLLGSLNCDEYIAEFAFNYGDWTRGLALDLWNGRARSASDQRYFQYGMLRRICESSKAVVVHNPAALAAVKQHAPNASVAVIPHLFEPPPSANPADLRVPPGTTVLGLFGHLRESKRISTVLRVFCRLKQKAILLLAGQPVSQDVSKFLSEFSIPGVLRFPFSPDNRFWELAYATDICINLRYPSAAETSGIGIRFMGIGRPVLATAGPELAEFPAGAIAPIESGLSEADHLEATLVWLIENREDARAIGAEAAQHISAKHSLERVAAQYWRVLQEQQ